MRRMRARVLTMMAAAALGATAGTAAAQARLFENWKETAAPRAPSMTCADLRALTNYDFSIDTATAVPARDAAPAFCRVQGLIAPEVRFDVSLPAKWNGRLYMFGNGGYAGENLAAPPRVAMRDRALAAGFAVASTNTGHDAAREPLGSFAVNPQKLIDYAYRAVHVTAMTAKTLARAYYGTAVAHSYFLGCSTGGRQGLISAQRFPADFDGIVVGAPVLDFTGTMMHYARMQQAAHKAPGLIDKFGIVAARLYEKCDAVDGVKDGIIDDPRRCSFDPAVDVPVCGSGAPNNECLTPEELTVFKTVYGPVMVNGTSVFPGFPPGPEIQDGWIPWLVNRNGPALSETFLDTFFKYMVTPGREIDWRTHDPEKDAPQLQTIGALLNATDPDLTTFRARGGKILMYYGWADPALSPLMGVKYFEQVRQTMKTTDDFFRLFMMPGMFHCGGGPGPDGLDSITPLVQWVERGVAPERLVAAKRQGDRVTRTRPLCPYPQTAVYKGSGSVDEAANFDCRAAPIEQKLTK